MIVTVHGRGYKYAGPLPDGSQDLPTGDDRRRRRATASR